MTLLTLAKYFLGSRDAILCVARSPQAIWIGLLFVLAAGFAREYDGEDLLHEPWHLLIPLGASLATSLVLYLLVRTVAWCRSADQPGLVSGYLTFLGLYWMTAPLALLYAIPVERFMSAGDATSANLWLLAIVSLWRVVLISRAISVLYGASFVAAALVVMLFADSLALAILRFTPLPIFVVMGGLRYTESEITLQLAALLVGAAGIVSWPIWAIGTIGVAVGGRKWAYEPSAEVRASPSARHVWVAATVAVVTWAFVLPFTQPEQQLRRSVERDLRGGRIEQALIVMSDHEQNDFPPHWDPPPRVGYWETQPDIATVLEHAERMRVAPWVRALFVDKFENTLRGRNMLSGEWGELTPDEVERRLLLLERLPPSAQLLQDLSYGLDSLRQRGDISDKSREIVAKLLEEAGVLDFPVEQYGSPNGGHASSQYDAH